MQYATVIFNRQVIRLCKGVLKAWEQWMDEVEHDIPAQVQKPELPKVPNDGEPYDRIVNS
jgi:hypothetical protein